MKKILYLSLILLSMLLTACAIYVPKKGVYYHGVHVRTSKALLLYPVKRKFREVYVETNNKTQVKSLNGIKAYFSAQLKKEGYIIVNSKRKANFIVRLNILLAAVTSPTDANVLLLQGYKGRVTPAGVEVLGRHVVNKTRTDHFPSYTVVLDLAIEQRADLVDLNNHLRDLSGDKWYSYGQRIVATYAREFNPTCFYRLQPQFNKAIAEEAASAF